MQPTGVGSNLCLLPKRASVVLGTSPSLLSMPSEQSPKGHRRCRTSVGMAGKVCLGCSYGPRG